MPLPQLETILAYNQSDVIERYRRDFPKNSLKAEEAFEEMLKYLWLTQKHRADTEKNPNNLDLKFSCDMHKEMSEIDDMWHTFLLFTKEYTDFCHNYFNCYIHHYPNTHPRDLNDEEFWKELNLYLSYIYDNLGETTLRKWFSQYM